ncbi:MAG: hypothetical protein N3C12_01735 [Candidatus Binatia bacterium]|nr:hypothetical protein [Candidatus Binatia bacterium]
MGSYSVDRTMLISRRRILSPLVLALAATAIVVQARVYDWKLDDAYITFAYARNWVEGHGIDFNVGERVEGYTCVLWVVLSALGLWVGFSIEPWSTWLGVTFAVGSALAAAGLAAELLPANWRRAAVGAALLVPLGPPLSWRAASGMETTLFAFLVTSSFWMHVRTSGRSPWVGVLAALAALTRPEGWLLGVLLSADALRHQGRKGVGVGLAFAAIFAPYFAWRVWYYGYLLPNTFYAKVGSTAEQVARGWVYLKLFLWDWGLVLLLASWIPLLTTGWRPLIGIYTFLALYAAYVVSVGGDVFHFFRFWTPIVPTLCALTYAGVLTMLQRSPIWQDRPLPAAVTVMAACWLATSTAKAVSAHLQHRKAENFLVGASTNVCRCLLRKTTADDRIAALGIGVLKWCSNRHIVDMLGLTDLHIARYSKVPMGGGLAGHEKYDSRYVLSLKPKYILLPPLEPHGLSLPAQRDMWGQPEFLEMYQKDECGYRRKEGAEGLPPP